MQIKCKRNWWGNTRKGKEEADCLLPTGVYMFVMSVTGQFFTNIYEWYQLYHLHNTICTLIHLAALWKRTYRDHISHFDIKTGQIIIIAVILQCPDLQSCRSFWGRKSRERSEDLRAFRLRSK